jgi:hypothetical protein
MANNFSILTFRGHELHFPCKIYELPMLIDKDFDYMSLGRKFLLSPRHLDNHKKEIRKGSIINGQVTMVPLG